MLPLIIPLTILVLNIGIIFGVGPLLDAIEEPPWATWLILISCMLLVLFNTILAGYLTYRYAPRFYAREGTVELPGEYGSISSWILYIVTFLGPVFCQPEYLTSRQAVVICLCSYGGFLLYLGRNNFRVGGACFGGLSLLAALGFGLGLPLPFTGQNGFFLTLMGDDRGGGPDHTGRRPHVQPKGSAKDAGDANRWSHGRYNEFRPLTGSCTSRFGWRS